MVAERYPLAAELPSMDRLSPFLHRVVAPATLALALLAVAVIPASAEPPPALEGPVTDHAGVLDEAEVAAAIERTLDEHGVQVWVLFVESTDGQPATDYASETFRINSMGADDVLLLVAIDDRTDAIWVADGLDGITPDEVDEIISGELEPRLRDGDFTEAAVATVEALGQANSTSEEPIPPAEPEPTPAPQADGGGALGFLLPLLVIGAIVGGVLLVARAVRARSAGEERNRRTGALAREANELLISTDERIRDAGQEVDFVEAQYGPAEVDPLKQAVAQARDELRAAFGVRQRLDDAEPETPEAREQMLREIVERLTRANAALDAQTERIQRLRDLERDAPATLAALPERIGAVEERLPAGEAALAALGRYAPSATQSVRGNVVEARKGLAGASEAVTAGTAALQAGDTAKAASATRLALEGVTGATGLLDGIDRLGASIAAAEQELPAELRETETDLADAVEAAGAEPASAVATRLDAAQRALADARAAASAAPADPAAALSKANEAHRLADEVLAAAREQAAAKQRLAASASASIRTAAAAVDRAGDFIATRRPGVGRAARTRLAEAERNLTDAQALERTDPAMAAQAAGRAERMANEAYSLADDDFNDWDNGGPGWGQRRGSGGDVAGAILGGILGGILSGGGTGGGGWGGSPWGGSGGSRGGGFPGWGGGGFGGGGGGGVGGGGGGGGGFGRGGRW
jgi:uncharacterized membrane protein YgcG